MDQSDPIPERRGRPRGEQAPVLSLSALEAVRLVLRGGSVVDWYRLNFTTDEEAERFVRTLELDPDNPVDRARVERLRRSAASYLVDVLGYRLPPDLLTCPPLDLLLYAAERKGRRRDRLYACLLLKVMHIEHHILCRELRYRLPLSQSALAQLLITKVDRFAQTVIESGFPLVEYSGGEKTLESMVTKLLVKREHHSATIRDRVRFRFIVERPADLVPLMHEMTSSLLPFNYVVPSQTVNHLVNFTALIESHEAYRRHAADFQVELGHEDQTLRSINEFSGATFRVINFVADVPIRVSSDIVARGDDDMRTAYGDVVFGLAEFQIVDEATARENETGENRHDVYKSRQLARVRERLERGLRGGADAITSDGRVP